MNIFVGNLAYAVTDQDLTQAFGAFGEVRSAKVIMDRETGRAKGFGFVEMESKSDGIKAISALNGTELKNREMVVNESRPREDRGGANRSGGNRNERGGYARRY